MNKPTLYASSNTLDGIREMIVKFYCGTPITLTETEGEWSVSTPTRKIPGVRVVSKKGRYRFEAFEA